MLDREDMAAAQVSCDAKYAVVEASDTGTNEIIAVGNSLEQVLPAYSKARSDLYVARRQDKVRKTPPQNANRYARY